MTHFSNGFSGPDIIPSPQNRHVSLANIATAFLSERKSSSRRHSSGRRKKRLNLQEKKSSTSRPQSSFSTGVDDLFGQRSSSGNMESSIVAMFMTSSSSTTTNANNKHRNTLVRRTVPARVIYSDNRAPDFCEVRQVNTEATCFAEANVPRPVRRHLTYTGSAPFSPDTSALRWQCNAVE